MTDTSPMHGRVALVTGASRGLGYAICKKLAAEGAHVIAVARTQGGLEDLDDEIREMGGACTIVPMDLQTPDGIEKLADIVAERWEKLDALVVNAGVLGLITPTAQLTAKVWNEVMAVNLIAPARFIRAFEPLLKASDAGRAVFTTSGVGSRRAKAYWAAYGASKAALDNLVMAWAQELENSTVRANLVNPGTVRTRMRAKAAPGEDPKSLPHPDEIAPVFVSLCYPAETRTGEIIDAQ
jgi:NAD(P)-dependent dehydrogenase (short-subunit alcohol dehydrogenase family)